MAINYCQQLHLQVYSRENTTQMPEETFIVMLIEALLALGEKSNNLIILL